MASFLEDYFHYTRQHEGPDLYHVWTGLAMVSSCLGRRVSLSLGHFNIYPCLYVVFVSESGFARKSSSQEMGVGILEDAKIESKLMIIRNEISPQQLFREMSLSLRVQALIDDATVDLAAVEEEALKVKPRPVLLYSRELSLLLSKMARDNGMIGTLDEAYDCPPQVARRTKTAGSDILNDPCFNILSGVTPTWLMNNVKIDELDEGLLARIDWIWQPGRRFKRHRYELSQNDYLLREDLCRRLQAMTNLEGVMKLSPEADKLYERWYNSLDDALDRRVRGFASRQHVHMLKAAMIFCVSSGAFPVVEIHHVEAAIELIESVVRLMPNIFATAASTRETSLVDVIERRLRYRPGGTCSHSELLHNLRGEVTAAELHTVIAHLADEGKVEIIGGRGATGTTVFYRHKEGELNRK